MTAGPVAVGTVFAKNYLPLARVLAASFRRYHPDVPFIGVLADQPQSCFRPDAEPFRIVELADLEVPGFERLAFRYSRFQLSVVGKTYLLERLLDEGYDSALFLDVDTLVLGDLGALLDRVRRSPITIVPHLLTPLDGRDRTARELNILQSGVFNGGVVGVSDCAAARRFLAWWQDRVSANCRHSLADGLHFDQKWLDLVPAYFPDVCQDRDPRVNVAHWNLPERLAYVGDWRLFHFSGYDPGEPDRVTRYADRVAMSSILRPLFARYQQELEAVGWPETADWPYAYGVWDNGVPIPDVVRTLYDGLGDEASRFGDPFRTASRESFFRWLNQPVDGDGGLTRLWAEILARRPDAQLAFPEPFGVDREALIAWTRHSGAAEHEIPDELVMG
jgi:hypothetical protein